MNPRPIFTGESIAPMTPSFEKAVRLNNIETALIYSRPRLYGHARFFYLVRRETETGFSLSEPYTGFYSVDDAESELAIYAEGSPDRDRPAVVKKEKTAPAPAPAQHLDYHEHHCRGPHPAGSERFIACINPDCWRIDRGSTRHPIHCPRCNELTDGCKRFEHFGKVSELVPPMMEAVQAA